MPYLSYQRKINHHMKKIIVAACAALALVASSCSLSTSFYSASACADFRPIQQETGVYLTQASAVAFDYEPVGIVEGEAVSGKYKGHKVTKNPGDGIYGESKQTAIFGGSYRVATVEDAVAAIAREAQSKGATDVINVTCNVFRDKDNKIIRTYASGMAVRRK